MAGSLNMAGHRYTASAKASLEASSIPKCGSNSLGCWVLFPVQFGLQSVPPSASFQNKHPETSSNSREQQEAADLKLSGPREWGDRKWASFLGGPDGELFLLPGLLVSPQSLCNLQSALTMVGPSSLSAFLPPKLCRSRSKYL